MRQIIIGTSLMFSTLVMAQSHQADVTKKTAIVGSAIVGTSLTVKGTRTLNQFDAPTKVKNIITSKTKDLANKNQVITKGLVKDGLRKTLKTAYRQNALGLTLLIPGFLSLASSARDYLGHVFSDNRDNAPERKVSSVESPITEPVASDFYRGL